MVKATPLISFFCPPGIAGMELAAETVGETLDPVPLNILSDELSVLNKNTEEDPDNPFQPNPYTIWLVIDIGVKFCPPSVEYLKSPALASSPATNTVSLPVNTDLM